MMISLEEAARLLGKSARQVRYMIRGGSLKGHKVANRWMVHREDLPLPPPQAAAQARKKEQVRATVERALGVEGAAADGAFLHQLRAARVLLPLHAPMVSALGPEHRAVVAIEWGLRMLARGCHRFHPADKVGAYFEGRDAVADAALALVLTGRADAAAWADTLEREVLPAMNGLIARYEAPRGR